MDTPKTFDTLATESTWYVMQELATGKALGSIVRHIMQTTLEWREGRYINPSHSNREEYLERSLGQLRAERNTQIERILELEGELELKNESVNRLMRQLKEVEDVGAAVAEERDNLKAFNAELHEENQKLRSGQAAQAQDITELNRINGVLRNDIGRLTDLSESYQKENIRLRSDVGLLEAEIEGLRQAPEVIKREMNALVQEVSQQRDAAKAACGTNAALLERTRKDFAQAIQQRDQARAEWQAAQRLVKELEEKLATEKLHGDLAVAQKDELEQKNKELLKERDEAKADADGIKKFNDELHEENNLLRHEIEGLKQAPEEVLKSGINALVREISRQRDAEKLRGDVAVAQRDEWIEKHNTCKGALENNERVLNDIIRQRDQARADWQASQRLVKELEDGHNAKNEIIKKLQSNLDYVKLHVHNMNQVLK